ncbi:hypothetical protein [Dyella tabacisoli]|uniref:Uncharacterized protein n=1 Tax=Dyella tabacisoli TaxID=2282381 RepID=A0A369UPZ2_9GAMM|nr:hypothetical protein [Dyella tabacisoli]RDD82115.1 hypothetical protein DVJ77_08625 [Dyella tabacisoli]
MFDIDTVYALLPAWTRLRDAQQGSPLKDLLSVTVDQIAVLEEDLAQNYDNLFIETCAPWVVPYIGDLVQSTPLTDASRIAPSTTTAALSTDLVGPSFEPAIGLRARADVAKTIFYRRRKTTLPMLEELSSDVTGWAAHVREFFQTLAWTQAVRNHVRPGSFYAPDLRNIPNIDRINGPFDNAPRLVDVRVPRQLEGWHNIPNVGIFLWRLFSSPLYQATARPEPASGGSGFHVSRLGQDAPMFTRWQPGIDATLPSAEPLLPGPIRPAAFYDDLLQYAASASTAPYTQYYGRFGLDLPAPGAPSGSFFIVADGVAVLPAQIQSMNLAQWRQPPASMVGVDVALGRLSFGSAWKATGLSGPKQVSISTFCGFPAELGGGGYDRQNWLLKRNLPGLQVFTVGTGGTYATISAALTAAAGIQEVLISIQDSASYVEALSIKPVDGGTLTIEAVDQHWPHVQGSITIQGVHPTATVTLSGLLVEGAVQVTDGLSRLRLIHTTLVPGLALNVAPPVPVLPSVVVDKENTPIDVELIFSISGPVQIPPLENSRLWLLDSIIDGVNGPAVTGLSGSPNWGPPAWIERSTVVGASHFRQLLSATETLFDGVVSTLHRQQGCVRFSFVPDGSTTPRRYRCQPDLEISIESDQPNINGALPSAAQLKAIHDNVVSWLLPSFTQRQYGQPAYLQLHLNAPIQILQGAQDGSEMGAYCHLKQPQRLKNLQLRLQEYLPFGRQAATLFVT